MHWRWAFWDYQAGQEGLSAKQVDCRVQLQHQLTYLQALPPDLPVELILKPPIGVLALLFLLPNGWAAVLDDNRPPNIAPASRGGSEIRDRDLHRESTPVPSTHVPLPATLPQHRLQGRVFVIYVYSTLTLFHTSPVVEYIHPPSIFNIQALRQLRCLPCFTQIIFIHRIRILDRISSLCPLMSPLKLTPPSR